MAVTSYGVNANETVKLWSRQLFTEIETETVMASLMGTDSDSVIQVVEDTQKSAGDRVTMQLRVLLSGRGVVGNAVLENNEERLTTYTQNLLIDHLRHGVRTGGQIDEQRIPWDMRENAMKGLRDWWADRIDVSTINQLAGNTGQSDLAYTGHNATVAPSSATGNTRILYGGGTHTTENSLSSSSESFSLTYIDRAINQAQIATPLIRMPNTPWGKGYVMILHPNIMRTLATNSAANTISIWQIQQAQVQGGKSDKFERRSNFPQVFKYRDTFIVTDDRIPLAPSTTTVYRNLFLGAQAGAVAFGKRDGNRGMSWKEKLFDYDEQLGVKAVMIWGCTKTTFNSRDLGTIVISAMANAP